MEKSNSRIEYLDIAKGLCIFLVVMIHTGVPEIIPHIYASKVVLFFVLSGYFYHDDIPCVSFIKKKMHTLLVPFLFFYVISYVFYYLMIAWKPSFATLTDAKGIFDCFTQKNYFNGPVWFLLSLFEIQMIVFLIRKLFRKEKWQWLIYLALFVGGYYLSIKNVDLSLNLDSSITFVVFFAIGYKIHELRLLESLNAMMCLICSLIGYLLFCIFPIDCYASINRYGCNNVGQLFLMILVLSLTIILFCKVLSEIKWKWLGIFSYSGKHTLWILCSHHLVYRPIKMICSRMIIGNGTLCAFIVFLLTILICLQTASYMERKIPWALGK